MIQIEGNSVFVEFDNIADFVSYASKGSADTEAKTTKYSENFCKYSWNETLAHIEGGFIENMKEISDKVDMIADKLVEVKEQYFYDVSGMYIDMGQYLTGTPECFVDCYTEEHTVKEVIKLTINIGARSFVSGQVMINRGAAIVALIDKLQENHILDITFVNVARRTGKFSNWSFKFRMNTENGYSRNLILFLACHPGAFRRLIFACRENVNGGFILGDYGSTYTYKDQEGITLEGLNALNQVDYQSVESAIDTVIRLYKQAIMIKKENE